MLFLEYHWITSSGQMQLEVIMLPGIPMNKIYSFVPAFKYKPSMMTKKPYTTSWYNILAHLEPSAILCIGIPGQRMDASFTLI